MRTEASSFSLQELVDFEEMRTNAPRISAVVFRVIATFTCSFYQLQVLPGWPHPPHHPARLHAALAALRRL